MRSRWSQELSCSEKLVGWKEHRSDVWLKSHSHTVRSHASGMVLAVLVIGQYAKPTSGSVNLPETYSPSRRDLGSGLALAAVLGRSRLAFRAFALRFFYPSPY